MYIIKQFQCDRETEFLIVGIAIAKSVDSCHCNRVSKPIVQAMQLVHLLGSVVFLLATLSSSSLVACQSIDTRQPILREVSGLADGSMFGYTLVLHQTSSNPSNMNQAINGAR